MSNDDEIGKDLSLERTSDAKKAQIVTWESFFGIYYLCTAWKRSSEFIYPAAIFTLSPVSCLPTWKRKKTYKDDQEGDVID